MSILIPKERDVIMKLSTFEGSTQQDELIIIQLFGLKAIQHFS